jgi:hypothetical protein
MRGALGLTLLGFACLSSVAAVVEEEGSTNAEKVHKQEIMIEKLQSQLESVTREKDRVTSERDSKRKAIETLSLPAVRDDADDVGQGEASEESTRLAIGVQYDVPAADSQPSHCTDPAAVMHDPAYCARIANADLGITGALSYSVAANCPDDGITSKGFCSAGDSAANAGASCIPWKSEWWETSARLGLSKCLLDSATSETVCTKGAVEHPHMTTSGVGILVYKRMRCTPSGKCFVHKAGLCLDLGDCAGPAFTEAECLAAAQNALPADVTQGRTTLQSGSWSHVPAGCSVQSGGDWAAHFNTNPNGVDSAGSFTSVALDMLPRLQPKHVFDWGGAVAGVNTADNKDGFAEQATLTLKDFEDHGIPPPMCTGRDKQLADLRILAH